MGKFLVKKTNTGFKFDLYAGNGEVIASSEVYSTEVLALRVLKVLPKTAPIANFEDLTEDPARQRLIPNLRCIPIKLVNSVSD